MSHSCNDNPAYLVVILADFPRCSHQKDVAPGITEVISFIYLINLHILVILNVIYCASVNH